MLLDKIKKLGLFALVGACFVALAACADKKPVLVTGAVSPIPTATASPTPSPVVSLHLDENTVFFAKTTYVEENKTEFIISIKDGFTYANGKILDADLVIEQLEKCIAELGCGYDGGPEVTNSGLLSAVTREGKMKIPGIREFCFKNSTEGLAAIDELAASYVETGRKHAADEAEEFWQCVDRAWKHAIEGIIANCIDEYSDYAEAKDDSGKPYFGSYKKTDLSNEGLKIAFSMVMWGFGNFEENGTGFTTASGKSFDTAAGVYPSADDFVQETEYFYSNDAEYFYNEECSWLDDVTVLERAFCYFEELMSAKNENPDAAQHIAGIKKSDEHTVTITVEGICDLEPDALLGIDVISQ